MKSRDFVYWLQGYLEIAGAERGSVELTEPQIKIIRNHLALVFKHEIDAPDADGSSQAVHDGKTRPSGLDTLYRC